MPPKKQTIKKGLVYKAAIPPKDILPPSIKEPPRQSRPFKLPENFQDPEFKNEFEPKEKLEAWPGNQQAKAFDFGVQTYSDPQNHLVTSFFNNEKLVIKWKQMKTIEKLQSYQQDENQSDDESIHSIHSQNNVNYIFEDDILQEQVIQQDAAKELVMIDTILRDQTLEETQKRKALEAQKLAKDKKKATKKDETKQDMNPQKIKDVELPDILTYNYMLKEAKWIGGHLQLIKDKDLKDVYTNEPIWKKIYPQVDGIPVLSKSGRYWVKLYHMGKQVKIQVDSQFPIDNKCRYLFPLSKRNHERWTLIITKALIKLMSINNAPTNLCGDGITLYALTGMISETIRLENFKEWGRLDEYLNDHHYLSKDIVVTCWASSKFKSVAPSNYIKNYKDCNKLFELGNSDFKQIKKKLERSNSGFLPRVEDWDKSDQPTAIQSGIETQHCYLVGDYLHNGGLNMAYVQNRSMKQMVLRQTYNELNQVSLSTKTKDQKLQHRRKKKQLKEKINFQQQKRLQLMHQPNKPSYFIKVNSDLKIHCDYSTEEIGIAKKCILNGLSKPPNYQVYDPKEDAKSLLSHTMVVKKQQKEKDEMSVKALNDFSSIPHAIDPLVRPQKGVWIQSQDFLRSFQFIQFYYDPSKFQNQVVHKVQGQNGIQFTIQESKEVLMIQKQQKQQAIRFLFGFAPQYPKEYKQFGTPYSLLQKFNFDQYVAIQGTTPLQDPLSSYRMELQNRNHLYKIVTVARSGYCYWFSSNSNFKLMSIINYLTDYQNYTTKQLSTEHLPVEANKYNLYFRLEINGGDVPNIMFIKIRGIDVNVLKHLRYKLIKPCEANDNNLLLQDGKYFEEKALIVDLQNKIDIEPKTKYYLLLEGVLPFSIKGSTVDIDIYTKSPLQVELVESVQPLKYLEKYVPNKYGLICRERLFVNSDTVATLLFQIVQAQLVPKDNLTADKKAPPKKGGKDEGVEVAQNQLKQKRTIRFELYEGEQLIAAKVGANIALISNVELLSTKQGNHSYYIQANFDLHEWPQAKLPQATNNICWSLKITSSESVAVVRDTFQQDKDKEIKKQWEDADPGRAERAKKSRRRYLIENKKQNGEILTEQEQAIISQPRLTKRQILEQEKRISEQKNKSKAPPKKDQKKGKKQQIKTVVQQQKPKQFPKSSDNIMRQLYDYLSHLQGKRVTEDQSGNYPCVRNEQDIRAIKQAGLMSQEDRVGHIIRNIRNREANKITQNQDKQTLQIFFQKVKQEMKLNWTTYIGKRNSLFEESKQNIERDKNVISILRGEKTLPTEADIQKAMKDYGASPDHNAQLLIGLQMLWKNKKIAVLSDRLTSALSLYDMDEVSKIRADIDRDKVEGLVPQLFEQLINFEQEFKNNPSAIAEKQAQLKKQKKGGKK